MTYTFVLQGDITDTYSNLATEHAIMSWINSQAMAGKSIYGLFLWQSGNAIVCGRNQNISKECNMQIVIDNDIALVRRETGGGAVYHDLGNLCFTFFSTKDVRDREKNFRIVIKALDRLNVKASISGRNDILIDGKKISGNAFRQVGSADLHHGTILVNANLELAIKCLTPNKYKLKSKGIDSVRARIANLTDFSPSVTLQSVRDGIVSVFAEETAETGTITPDINDSVWDDCYSRLKSESWIYRTDFAGQKQLNGEWGIFAYTVVEEEGVIADIRYESDILDTDVLECLIGKFRGVALDYDAVKKILFVDDGSVLNGLFAALVKDIAERLATLSD